MKIFLTFLGTTDYTETQYRLEGSDSISQPTRFVQTAELELLGKLEKFDRVFVIATKASRDKHWDALARGLEGLGELAVVPECIPVDDDMSAEGQWVQFEQIVERVPEGAQLTVDVTHGYRAFPIVLSAAINLLVKLRGVTINAVYYGAYVSGRHVHDIVDLAAFYAVNAWADAVVRLVDHADARSLAEVARQAPKFHAPVIAKPEVIGALEMTTRALLNVFVNGVGDDIRAALDQLISARGSAGVFDSILIDKVVQKFASLAPSQRLSGRYDVAYFKVQVAIVDLLFEHRLYMQGFTVARELLGSIGLSSRDSRGKWYRWNNADRQRTRADVFVRMLDNDPARWSFSGDHERMRDSLLPQYEAVKDSGCLSDLRAAACIIRTFRNGFDHAWVSKSEVPHDLTEQAMSCLTSMRGAVEQLIQRGVIAEQVQVEA